MTAETTDGETTRFKADALDHLRLGIRHAPDQVDIEVLLHEKPHVDIRRVRRAPHCVTGRPPNDSRDPH